MPGNHAGLPPPPSPRWTAFHRSTCCGCAYRSTLVLAPLATDVSTLMICGMCYGHVTERRTAGEHPHHVHGSVETGCARGRVLALSVGPRAPVRQVASA